MFLNTICRKCKDWYQPTTIIFYWIFLMLFNTFLNRIFYIRQRNLLPLKAFFGMSIFGMSMVGCSTFSDGSLDYKESHLLKPMALQSSQIAAIRPIYPLPKKINQDKVVIANESGTQYVLPKPDAKVQLQPVAKPAEQPTKQKPKQKVAQKTVKQPNNQPSNQPTKQPVGQKRTQRVLYKALTENKQGVPILQVQANAETTTQKLLSVLTKANYRAVNMPKTNRIMIANDAFAGNRVLQLSNVGTVTTVIVTEPNKKLANISEAKFILHMINNRW